MEGISEESMGIEYHFRGVQDTFYRETPPKEGNKRNTCEQGDDEGDDKPSEATEGEGSDRISSSEGERCVLFNVVLSDKTFRGLETHSKPERVKRFHFQGVIQDGRHSDGQEHHPEKRLDDQDRPKGCILRDPLPRKLKGFHKVHVEEQALQISSTNDGAHMFSKSLHKGHARSGEDHSKKRNSIGNIHRRSSAAFSGQGSSVRRNLVGFSSTQGFRLRYKCKVKANSGAGSRFLGILRQFTFNDIGAPKKKVEAVNKKHSTSFETKKNNNKKISKCARKVAGNSGSDFSGKNKNEQNNVLQESIDEGAPDKRTASTLQFGFCSGLALCRKPGRNKSFVFGNNTGQSISRSSIPGHHGL